MELGPVGIRVATGLDAPFVLGLAGRFGSPRAPWRDFDEVVSGTQRQLAAALDAQRETEAVLIAVTRPAAALGFYERRAYVPEYRHLVKSL